MWGDWIYRALTFLVISCPCALVISIPLSFFAGIGGASNQGVLVKGSNYLETLAKQAKKFFEKVFDKKVTMGLVEARNARKEDNRGRMQPITKVTMKMQHPVREDLLRYLQSNITA